MYKIIETKKLTIRPFTLDDTSTVFLLSQESGMKQWLPDQVYKDEKHAEEVLSFLISQYTDKLNPTEKPIVYAVVLKDKNEVIGHVGLSPYLDDTVEVGYAIAEKESGKGHATQAVKAFSKWGIETLKIKKILGIVREKNIGSAKVLEKAGYKLESEKVQMYQDKMRLCRNYSIT